jgi:mycothione reductase
VNQLFAVICSKLRRRLSRGGRTGTYYFNVQHFSLAIIGSGSGNVLVPKDPARGPVALIEAGAFGGTCLNRGCIPSKILVHTADLALQVRHAADFGIDAKLTG